MRVTIKNLEVRGKEKKESNKGREYLIVRCEDDTGKAYEFYDPNIENFDFYKKGIMIDMIAELSQYRGRWNVRVSSFEQIKE